MRMRNADASGRHRRPWRRGCFEPEIELALLQRDRHRTAALEPAEENLVRQWIAHFGLNHAGERPSAVHRVEAFFGEPRPGVGFESDRDATFGELRLEL